MIQRRPGRLRAAVHVLVVEEEVREVPRLGVGEGAPDVRRGVRVHEHGVEALPERGLQEEDVRDVLVRVWVGVCVWVVWVGVGCVGCMGVWVVWAV